MIPHLASKGCMPLTNFVEFQDQEPRIVRDTSKESYQNLEDKETQVNIIEDLLKNAKEGLTDFEIKNLLVTSYGISLPKSTISARRNDITRKYGRHIIFKTQETRKNKYTKKSCIVWRHIDQS